MNCDNVASTYEYHSAERAWADGYLSTVLLRHLTADHSVRRVLDAGCGNGHLARRIAAAGYEVTGFDSSTSGVALARDAKDNVRFDVVSGYDDLRAHFGSEFDACVCVEVVEHLYDPRRFTARILDVLRPGGLFIVTTPYHGYLKNLALALTGKMDSHHTALWDGGHIKFWSRTTLTRLLREVGFASIQFEGAGRMPLLWKSMVLTARKPNGRRELSSVLQ
jgi:2-polyprenyl-3-methyl-5-hydroxy-6-metoxy-1,4-benzoquinol methylase